MGHFAKMFHLFCFTILTSLAIGSQTSPIDTKKQENSHLFLEFDTPEYCPLEHYYAVTQVKDVITDEKYLRVGEKIAFKCSSNNETVKEAMEKSPGEFTVYPTPTRTCQSSGKWSGPRPTCIWKNTVSKQKELILTEGINCTADPDKCPKERKNWRPIGQILPECSRHKKDFYKMSYKKEFEVVVTFVRSVPLSFMTFKIPNNSRNFNVEVRVPPEDVIDEFSPESERFLSSHYDSFKETDDAQQNDNCAVTQLRAFTRQVLFRFSIEATDNATNWRPKEKFYSLNDELNETKQRKWFGYGCPDPPLIPNASSVQSVQSETSEDTVITYTCEEGFLLVDPLTNKPSNGRVECLNKYEWDPYPFPVCLPYVKYALKNVSPGSEDSASPPLPKSNDWIWYTCLAVLLILIGIPIGFGAIYLFLRGRNGCCAYYLLNVSTIPSSRSSVEHQYEYPKCERSIS